MINTPDAAQSSPMLKSEEPLDLVIFTSGLGQVARLVSWFARLRPDRN
jgi:hypothetical protein